MAASVHGIFFPLKCPSSIQLCVTKIKYFMYNVQEYSVFFYKNAVHSVICEGWYFIITLFARLYARVGIL